MGTRKQKTITWIVTVILVCILWWLLQSETVIHYERPKAPGLELEPLQLPFGPSPDNRVSTIRQFFKVYNPEMAMYSGNFVIECDSVGVDPYLPVAIGSLESGYFNYCVGHNCYGHNSRNGYLYYATQKEGISKACGLLGHKLYAGKTIKQIGRIYAEDISWSSKVESIYKTIKSYEN